jgi:hypothetical protein
MASTVTMFTNSLKRSRFGASSDSEAMIHCP